MDQRLPQPRDGTKQYDRQRRHTPSREEKKANGRHAEISR